MHKKLERRQFLKQASIAASGLIIPGCADSPFTSGGKALYEISLAEWSLHRSIFGAGLGKRNWGSWEKTLQVDPHSVLQGSIDHLDFAIIARQFYGIYAVEYVNVFFFDRAQDQTYLKEMKTRADGEGVKSLLIMCDHEGRLGDADANRRHKAVENHYKWAEAAKYLGCHAIRVNASSAGSYAEQQKLAADGLRELTEYCHKLEINVLVENHGGLSSNGQWLRGVMKLVDHPCLGTLPDFGNFQISDTEHYDNYLGLSELMPFARGVSAKSHSFDETGNETSLDYPRLLKIVTEAGYSGHVGIEYEGVQLSEHDGIMATKKLLERVRDLI